MTGISKYERRARPDPIEEVYGIIKRNPGLRLGEITELSQWSKSVVSRAIGTLFWTQKRIVKRNSVAIHFIKDEQILDS